MAFDRGDTDILYERSIRPVLRRNGITPVIINRRQSNDDLNKQIIEELGACDLCIADLTYTRPSVYYEAGYAERVVPVIYTVRTDHVRGSEESARVHFDLQMKPLIVWRRPSDEAFRKRLEGRLKQTFLTSWRRAERDLSARDAERTEFAKKSVAQRLAALRHLAMLAVRPFGLRRWTPQFTGADQSANLASLKHATQLLIADSDKHDARRIACVLAAESMTTTALRQLRKDLLWLSLFHSPVASRAGKRQVLIQAICLSLRPVVAKRVEAVFASYGRGDREGRFVYNFSDTAEHEAQVSITLDCLGGVRSESELKVELHSLVASTFGS